MINYRHPARPGRHHISTGQAELALYTSRYEWFVGAETITVLPGRPARHAAPVSLVKSV